MKDLQREVQESFTQLCNLLCFFFDILPFQSSSPPLKPIWAQVAAGTYPSLLNLHSKLFIRAPPATLLKHILLQNIFFAVKLKTFVCDVKGRKDVG